jgi:hypothetical protein
MANTGTWVGLDTNATAGRNGPITADVGTNDIECFVTHALVAVILSKERAISKLNKLIGESVSSALYGRVA